MLAGLKSKGNDSLVTRSAGRLRKIFSFSVLIMLQIGVPTSIVADENDDVMGDGLGSQFGSVSQKSWVESKISIPGPPEAESILPFRVFETPNYKYYLDAHSLNVSGGDNVVRYSVVIETPSGIRNVFYEGIRCDTQEYKMYAAGLWGENLSQINEPHWTAIVQQGTGIYRYDLFNYFLCHNSLIRSSKKDILQLIEYPPDNFIDIELE